MLVSWSLCSGGLSGVGGVGVGVIVMIVIKMMRR